MQRQKQRRRDLRCALGDAGARDAAVGAYEKYRIGVDVEPRLECAGPVADDGHIGVVVARPVQLRHRSGFDEVGPQRFPLFECVLAENRTQIVAPTQDREAGPEHVVEEDVLVVAEVHARLDEQGPGG